MIRSVLMLVAVICLVIALLGATTILSVHHVLAWFIGGMLAWAIDVMLTPYYDSVLGARRVPPA